MKLLSLLIVGLMLASCSKQGELENFGKSLTCDVGFEKFRALYSKATSLERSHIFVDDKKQALISVYSTFDQYELFTVFKPDLNSIYYSAIISKPFYTNREKSKIILNCSKGLTPHAN